MNEIQALFNKLNKLFIDRLLNNEFEIIEIDTYTIYVKIEDYFFNIWTENRNYKGSNFKCYYGKYNSMALEFTEEEQAILGPKFYKIADDSRKQTLINNIKALEEQLDKI